MTNTDPGGAPGAQDHPVSWEQSFLGMLDKGDEEGSFGSRHTVAAAWRVRGPLDVATLQRSLDDVVVRHEALRTTYVRGDGAGPLRQRVHPPAPAKLNVTELGDRPVGDREEVAERFFVDTEAEPHSVHDLPLVRASLGRFDDQDAVLVLVVHHMVADAWSMGVIAHDLSRIHASHRAGTTDGLPEPVPYRELAAWQELPGTRTSWNRSREYWRDKLAGAAMFTLPVDHPPAVDEPALYSVHRFLLDAATTSAVGELARRTRSSPFMVLLAAYKTLMHRRTGATDIVVPTFTAGRAQERFGATVGPFLNFMPLRTDLTGCDDLEEVLSRVRRTCLDAHVHDIPFPLIADEAPELMGSMMGPDRDVIAVEVLQSPWALDGDTVGDLEYTEIRRRTLSADVSSSIPDGGLWAMDVLPGGEIACSLKVRADLYDGDTLTTLVDDFRATLHAGTRPTAEC